MASIPTLLQLPVSWPPLSLYPDLPSVSILTSPQPLSWPPLSLYPDLPSASILTSLQPLSWPLFSLYPDLTSASILTSLQSVSWPLFSMYPDLIPSLLPLSWPLYGEYPNPSAAAFILTPPWNISWPLCCCMYPDPSTACIPTPLQHVPCLSTVCILSCILTFLRLYSLNHLQPVSWLLRSLSWPLSCVYPDPSAALCPVMVHPLLPLSSSLSWLFCGLLHLTFFILYPDLHGLHPDLSAACILIPLLPCILS